MQSGEPGEGYDSIGPTHEGPTHTRPPMVAESTDFDKSSARNQGAPPAGASGPAAREPLK